MPSPVNIDGSRARVGTRGPTRISPVLLARFSGFQTESRGKGRGEREKTILRVRFIPRRSFAMQILFSDTIQELFKRHRRLGKRFITHIPNGCFGPFQGFGLRLCRLNLLKLPKPNQLVFRRCMLKLSTRPEILVYSRRSGNQSYTPCQTV